MRTFLPAWSEQVDRKHLGATNPSTDGEQRGLSGEPSVKADSRQRRGPQAPPLQRLPTQPRLCGGSMSWLQNLVVADITPWSGALNSVGADKFSLREWGVSKHCRMR